MQIEVGLALHASSILTALLIYLRLSIACHQCLGIAFKLGLRPASSVGCTWCGVLRWRWKCVAKLSRLNCLASPFAAALERSPGIL